MRLSDLINKKGGPATPSAPVPVDKVPEKIHVVQEVQKPQATSPAGPQPASPAKQASAPRPTTHLRPAKLPTPSSSSIYDSLPSAIYQAAEQLEIPIPQNRQLVLNNARISLIEIFNAATDPSLPKDNLWEKVRNIVADLSMLLALDSNLAKLLERDSSTAEELSSHSINTALIAMDLAKEVKKIEFTAQEIGAAALLHDIGIAALNMDIDDEMKGTLSSHVEKAVEILVELKVPESVRVMVAQHHERMDGKGYPKGISGKDFLLSSQILALAETFERMMADSFDDNAKKGTPQQNYVQATLDNFHKALDPEILKIFISIRGFYPNGIMVELTNRSICLVLRQNEGFPLRPVIQVVLDSAGNHPETMRVIDLRSNNSLSIIKAITHSGDQR